MRRNVGDGHSKYLQSVIEYEKYIPSNFFHSDFLTFFFFLQVNQIAWRDNEVVLFLSTVYEAGETTPVLRRRPRNANSSHKKTARLVFGSEYQKMLDVPIFIDDYNHHMGGVDQGDQLRSAYAWQHRWRRGPTQALTWGFLLGTVLVNAFKLDSEFGLWKNPRRSHRDWRDALATQIFEKYSSPAGSRQRARPGIFLDCINMKVDIKAHRHGNRGKRAVCKVCNARRLAAKKRAQRQPLGELDTNALSQFSTARTPWGCLDCNVAICRGALCWNMFHVGVGDEISRFRNFTKKSEI